MRAGQLIEELAGYALNGETVPGEGFEMLWNDADAREVLFELVRDARAIVARPRKRVGKRK